MRLRALEVLKLAGPGYAVSRREPDPLGNDPTSHIHVVDDPLSHHINEDKTDELAVLLPNHRRADPDLATGIGALDREGIAEVRRMAWPDARDADEVHDALLTLGILPAMDAAPWREQIDALMAGRRGTRAQSSGEGPAFIVATERAALVKMAFPEVRFTPEPPLLNP